ncbi:MAG: OmpW family outer membrane protein, partial [Sphingomonadales bacterium]
NAADAGTTRATLGMANVYYDFDFGGAMRPYVGAGLGYGNVNFKNYRTDTVNILSDRDAGFAYQLIAGLRTRVSEAMDVTVDYRYVETENPKLIDSLGRDVTGNYNSHVVMVGLVWKFGQEAEPRREEPVRAVQRQPEPAPQPAPAPTPEPEPEPVVEQVGPFEVLFEWNSDTLTSQASSEIARAARAARDHRPVQLLLKGHADTSGAARYNQGLSERRAAAVRSALVSEGVSGDIIKTWGYGEDRLSVWTADDVRERQNRRVEIIFDDGTLDMDADADNN